MFTNALNVKEYFCIVSENKTLIGKFLSALGFNRVKYSSIGSWNDLSRWRSMLVGHNSAKVQVNELNTQSIPAYWRAIAIISEQIASLPISVYRKDSEGNISEATTHPLYKLLRFRPSPLYDSFVFMETVVRQLLLRGHSYVRPIRDSRGALIELRIIESQPIDIFEVDNVWFYRFATIDKPLRWDEILHFKAYSIDGIQGQNPMAVFDETLGRAISEMKFASSYYGNGARISGVLESEHNLKPGQREIVETAWNKSYSGPDNLGKTAVLGYGFKYKPVGNKFDANDVSARRLTTEDISNITGVHPILLGNLERASFSNVEELNRIFVQFTLRTWCERIEREINTKLFSNREMGKVYVDFNLDGLLRGDTATRAKYYQALYNIRAINPNEVRARENMNGYDGGNAFGMPLASNSKENNNDNRTE